MVAQGLPGGDCFDDAAETLEGLPADNEVVIFGEDIQPPQMITLQIVRMRYYQIDKPDLTVWR